MQDEPRPYKVIIIYDGETPIYAAFVDTVQERRIMEVLKEGQLPAQ